MLEQVIFHKIKQSYEKLDIMVNTLISSVIARAAELGVSSYEDSHILEFHPKDSPKTIATVILAIYLQILGNAYVMDSGRLTVLESKLKIKTVI